MPFYFLDTNILIDLAGEKASGPFFERALQEGDLRLATSILSVAEFMAGAGGKEEKFLRDWIKAGELDVIFIDSTEEAFRAGEFRRKQGLTLPDALIMLSALRVRAHLLTRDDALLKKAKTFLPVSDPVLEEPSSTRNRS